MDVSGGILVILKVLRGILKILEVSEYYGHLGGFECILASLGLFFTF